MSGLGWLTYIYHDHIGRDGFSDWGFLGEVSFVLDTSLKAEEHLLLANLGEVEFFGVKWLKDPVNTELSGSLLEVSAFIQLSNEPLRPRDHLGFTCSHIISEQPPAHSVLPLKSPSKIQKQLTIPHCPIMVKNISEGNKFSIQVYFLNNFHAS